MYQLQKTAHQLIIALAIIGFILDRILKFVVSHLPLGKVFAFVPRLDLGYYLNPALFFFPAWRFIPYLALVILVVITTYYMLHAKSLPFLVPVLLGGASNVFDRFAYGGVIDYVHIMGLATINIADILIFAGLILIMLKTYGQRS
ncbi:hypothetical protein A3B21_04955 [Candidatus Uhrbacteria bacterium RIFCSPLOWO2_01_FULL_47_24]|uniref:Uncharacterized protein n=1 Tax=Candidatus Uhrbacteria bacterium RIFCSPLOWO2_01_FULL_47_24 TaxID=1802401 RepID=A0A1F7UWM0_9BACT|nr:MAG: hypothetical protein A2753_02985 [Candidatus Uhrbacteria bacterium RIFCSPHIGHO2_01_FULL_47_11]OGL69302.1 MAG: hypothetical protein A3D58_03345 [Candidatus Uhrbacteria bacterium RIFCSPHIGHO2_02_FULL_46_47]OGL76372.1 MAG: hypothetical protein A3F52_00635 [Candidatus Uhrbacteria bacterium RIFCSPHIGHO2_12_FULL_47_11]OGL82037.1 MAG: hypothetical protein A3B21_04955 [Candidatus Uhrbacteria bacterium RIFCSPLOWO2_01_FULL_47_24]OGL85431.1 MAG: hypothetical protein A3J03_05120 [Candidatus Uhrbact